MQKVKNQAEMTQGQFINGVWVPINPDFAADLNEERQSKFKKKTTREMAIEKTAQKAYQE